MSIRKLVSKILVDRGYRRFGRSHVVSILPGFCFVVDTGLLQGGGTGIEPFVGIRADNVMELVARLMNETPSESAATVMANVGYVTGGEYLRWEDEDEVNDVIDAIDAAERVLAAYCTDRALPNAWQLKGTATPGWEYSYLAALCLAGNQVLLNREMRRLEAELCVEEDEVCIEFRGFSAALSELAFRE